MRLRDIFQAVFMISVAFLLVMPAAICLAAPPAKIAFDFDGEGSYIETQANAGNMGVDGNKARSVETWVYTRAFNGGGVFSMGATSRNRDFSLRTHGDTDRWRLQFWGPDYDFSFPSQDRWVHFALVHTGSEVILYADGEEVVRESCGLNTNSGGTFRIGRWSNIFFNGKIAEVRVWNRALSVEEIGENMRASLTGDEDGLAGYWPLNEGYGPVARDVAKGRDGHVAGDLLWDTSLHFTKRLETGKKEVASGSTIKLGPVELKDPQGEVSYQWYFAGDPLVGAVENELTISEIDHTDFGEYFVIVADEGDQTPLMSGIVTFSGWTVWRIKLSDGYAVSSGGRIGYPEIISPGHPYPTLIFEAGEENLTIEGEIVRHDGEVVFDIGPLTLEAGSTKVVEPEGASEEGRYTVRLRYGREDGSVLPDTYYFSAFDPRELPENYSRVVHPGEDGRLVYIPDYRGNRVPDFSNVGYRYGEEEIPEAPVRLTLEPEDGCNAARIQAALDEVSALEPDERGIRGAVLLKAGVYDVRGSVTIRADGVVLRGEGPGEDIREMWRDPGDWVDMAEFRQSAGGRRATVLITGGSRPLRISGSGGPEKDSSSVSEIIDNYVPVGAHTFSVDKPENFSVGDKIFVIRHGNADWIKEIGMDRIPGERPWPQHHSDRYYNLDYDRRVTAIDGNRITTESPLLTAIEQRWGGGRVYRYDDPGRVENSGIEGLRVIHNISRPSSTGGRAVRIRNARDVWVRDVAVEHFTDRGAFKVEDGTRNVTVKDCSALVVAPEHFGRRGRGGSSYQVPRYGFYIRSGGSHVLFSGCYARHSRHAFVLCAWVKGPNVYHDSVGEDSVTWSEPHHRWSSGGLFDNIEDQRRMAFMNRLNYGSGQGWAGANFVAWNTRGALACEQPPTAQNWAIGHVGRKLTGPFHAWNMRQFGYSYGFWESQGQHVKPESLYLRQLEERLTPND